jgi:hypothetical protein
LAPTLAALALCLGPAACGRTVLDAPVSPAGPGGSGGSGGAAGASGVAGIPGVAGVSGVAGVPGIAGQAGASSGQGGAAGTSTVVCLDGDTSCAGPNMAQICKGGAWQPAFFCPVQCRNGVCIECFPGATSCVSDTQIEVCSDQGIFGAATTCSSGVCRNDACAAAPAACVEGTRACAGPSSAQICMGGAWQPAFPCAGGCLDGVCSECVPATSMCLSATQIVTCSQGGIYGPPQQCDTTCRDGVCVQRFNHVFITSQTFVGGSLGGLAGADKECQALALAANLPGLYLAWLSDSTGSPSTRFTKDGGPYELVDGTIIAQDWAELTSGTLRHPIDMTEIGSPPAVTTACGLGEAAWTDTTPEGVVADPADSCGNWSDVMGHAFGVGLAADSDARWSLQCSGGSALDATCGTARAALYCFEQ